MFVRNEILRVEITGSCPPIPATKETVQESEYPEAKNHWPNRGWDVMEEHRYTRHRNSAIIFRAPHRAKSILVLSIVAGRWSSLARPSAPRRVPPAGARPIAKRRGMFSRYH